MAKSKSILSLQGTFQGMTHVDSRTYGKHIRAARGTYKPAPVNDTLKEVGKQLISANTPAKLIKDAFEPYRHDFYGGQMWQRLVSIFKKQFKLTGKFDFSVLKDFEIYKQYPLSRFTIVRTNTTFDRALSALTVSLSYSAPVFKKVQYLTGYRISIIGIFPHVDKMLTEFAHSRIISREEVHNEAMRLLLPVPPEADQVLLTIKFEGCQNDEIAQGCTTKGMAIVDVINIRGTLMGGRQIIGAFPV